MVAIAQPTKICTIDEFFALPDDGQQHELVRGEIRTIPLTGAEHMNISSLLLMTLGSYVYQKGLGKVYGGDGGFIINAAERTVRGPDVSFVAKERIPADIKGFFPVPPDLAVEIISPNDLYSEVDEKVEEYQNAGVRLIWVINPRRKQVAIYRGANPLPQTIDQTGTLDGEDVVQGFVLSVATLFT